VEVLVPLPEDKDAAPLLIARTPYGMGQVILVAFDLDEAPFTSWPGQEKFWDLFLAKTAPKPSVTAQDFNRRWGGMGDPEDSNDLASHVQSSLEEIPEVPVISFGWVALFILIYILIVGPIDYLFLKKVVKRLELTWITFPTVVLVISAVAYFTAYSLKGNDQ